MASDPDGDLGRDNEGHGFQIPAHIHTVFDGGSLPRGIADGEVTPDSKRWLTNGLAICVSAGVPIGRGAQTFRKSNCPPSGGRHVGADIRLA